jgi:hypothetical protein
MKASLLTKFRENDSRLEALASGCHEIVIIAVNFSLIQGGGILQISWSRPSSFYKRQ